jgi:hypothetical protein
MLPCLKEIHILFLTSIDFHLFLDNTQDGMHQKNRRI